MTTVGTTTLKEKAIVIGPATILEEKAIVIGPATIGITGHLLASAERGF
jgi:hypothetical protein